MTTTNDMKTQNIAMGILLGALMNPMVHQMEAIWRDTDDRHEGALCMALYLMQFAHHFDVASNDQAVMDELVALIEKRWAAADA